MGERKAGGGLPRIDLFEVKKSTGATPSTSSTAPTISSSATSEANPIAQSSSSSSDVRSVNREAGRWDAPKINYSMKGNKNEAIAAASSFATKQEALRELEEDLYAKTAEGPRESLLKTWIQFHIEWFGKEVPVFPLTPGKLAAMGAMFKKGGYRSFPNYISRAKEEHVQWHEWTDQLAQASRKIQRSVPRGLGEGRQSAEHSLTKIAKLKVDDEPVVEGGPIGPKNFVVSAPFFMLRELEASTSMANHIEWTNDNKVKRWLPAPKTDIMAKRTSLSWGCTCHGKGPGIACPYHALEAQLQLLEKKYGSKSDWADNLPLFLSEDGTVPTKEAMVATIEHFAAEVGDPLCDERGRRRMGGHSSRVTGARHLSRIGVEVYIIQLLARHSTAVILHYVKNVPLEAITEHYSMGMANRDLTEMLERCRADQAAVEAAKEEISDLQVNVVDLLHREIDLNVKISNLESKIGEATFVVNSSTNVWHKPATYNRRMAPTLWSTACGWSFGTKYHFRWENGLPKSSRNICDRCLPESKLLLESDEPPGSEDED